MIESLYILNDSFCQSKYMIYSKFKIIVIIYLYYLESIERYVEYLKNIPPEIDVEIYSSRKEVIEKTQYFYRSDNVKFYLKENRGRDISTVLVAARNSILKSDIVCFLHDKKEHTPHLKSETDIWINNLWGNLLGGEAYIQKIIRLFNENKNLGMLVPPDPIGEHLFHWFSDTWLDNYESTKQLGKQLGLTIDISPDVLPQGLGTAFWVRTDAIKKIFVKQWNYQDFPEEPIAIDGTLNHAIERIFGFVVKDSGYEVKTVMNSEYASYLISTSQKYMKVMFAQLQKREHVHNMEHIKNLDQREKKIENFCRKYKKIYIYGAGNYGKSLYHFVRERNYVIEGFVVSPLNRKRMTVENVNVFEIQELNIDENIGILIGVSNEFQKEIESILRQYGAKNYLYGY